MSTLAKPILVTEPRAVHITSDALNVELIDGRTISVPRQWFPRLMHGTAAELENYELSYDGIHWRDCFVARNPGNRRGRLSDGSNTALAVRRNRFRRCRCLPISRRN